MFHNIVYKFSKHSVHWGITAPPRRTPYPLKKHHSAVCQAPPRLNLQIV